MSTTPMTAPFGLEGVVPCRVTVSRETFADPDALRAALENVAGDGWISFTDRVKRWQEGPLQGESVPLYGELAVGPQSSIHFRPCDEGFELVRIEDDLPGGRIDAAAGAGGASLAESAHLAWEELYESSAPTGAFSELGATAPPFRYRVYTQKDPQGVHRPFAARFAGWGEAGS